MGFLEFLVIDEGSPLPTDSWLPYLIGKPLYVGRSSEPWLSRSSEHERSFLEGLRGFEFLVMDVESWLPYLTGKPLKPTSELGGLSGFPFVTVKAFLELFVVFEESSPLWTGLLVEEFGICAEGMSCSISNMFLTILSMNSLSVLLLKLIKKAKRDTSIFFFDTSINYIKFHQ